MPSRPHQRLVNITHVVCRLDMFHTFPPTTRIVHIHVHCTFNCFIGQHMARVPDATNKKEYHLCIAIHVFPPGTTVTSLMTTAKYRF